MTEGILNAQTLMPFYVDVSSLLEMSSSPVGRLSAGYLFCTRFDRLSDVTLLGFRVLISSDIVRCTWNHGDSAINQECYLGSPIGPGYDSSLSGSKIG